jgi:hypothetical protein
VEALASVVQGTAQYVLELIAELVKLDLNLMEIVNSVAIIVMRVLIITI